MKSLGLVISTAFLLVFGIVILRSVAPNIFPLYFIYLVVGVILFFVFSKIDFDIISIFSKQFYIGSIIFLLLPLIIGQVTRGVIRWVPIGNLSIQPSELVRPFLLVFFADYIYKERLTRKRAIYLLLLLLLPAFLILVQPSLGVTALTIVGFVGVVLASDFNKKLLVPVSVGLLLLIPVGLLVLAPYQRARIESFLFPERDPSGAGYNSLQSMISVGSGKLWGRGLGEGVQTQLSFLPERQTDFIFASVAEEMGFVGALFLTTGSFFLLYQIQKVTTKASSPEARAFVSGVFFTLFAQTMIHIGMNMGLFPITGVPLPLVSAGGSSLMATMITLGMVVGAQRKV
jgi:rod shape determining protein RodA